MDNQKRFSRKALSRVIQLSTSIQLIQTALARLIEMFPNRYFDPIIIQEYNRITTLEMERIRDFLILHYWSNKRDGSEFWRYCQNMSIPFSLQQKFETFKSFGRVSLFSEESYKEPSWRAMFIGLGILPKRYDPLVDKIPLKALKQEMKNRRELNKKIAATLPKHLDFIKRQFLSTQAQASRT